MAKIKVYEMDGIGVIVDTNPITNPDGTYTKAQNAVPDPSGEKGSIVKRFGWKKFIQTAGSGSIGGGVAVPFPLGFAGPNVQNPFTDIDTTLATLIAAFQLEADESLTQPLGASFGDNSDIFFWDWNFDFNEEEAEAELEASEETDEYAIADDPQTDGTSQSTTSFPLTFIGDGFDDTPDLVVFSKTDGSDAYRRTSLPDTGDIKLMPDAYIRGEDEGMFQLVQNSPISTSFVGRPWCNLNGFMYYAEGGYTVDTSFPRIRAYNGIEDRVVCSVPANVDVGASTPPRSIMWMIAANSKIYFSTYDGGTNNTGGGTVKGSVYELDPDTGALTKLGTTFPTGHCPYCLVWAYGRLWVGTIVNSDGDTTPGRVYYFRPSIDTAWTLDNTFPSRNHIVTGLEVFQGKLYASVYGNWTTTNGAVYTRSVTGTWSSVESALNYEYSALIVWPDNNTSVTSPTRALYTERFKTDGTGNNVRSSADGTTWNTVLSDTHNNVGEVFSSVYGVHNGAVKPVLWLSNDVADDGHAYNTVDGTNWTRRLINVTPKAENEVIYGTIIQI